MPRFVKHGCARTADAWSGLPALRLAGIMLGLLVASALPAVAAAPGASSEPLYLFGIPVDFILFALTLLGVALFHHHTLYVALAGTGGDRRLPARLHRLQGRGRPRRPHPPHAARVGGARQPVPAADGLCAAVAAFREEPGARRHAGHPARRLEGRLLPAGHRVRAVELPRQYRRGPDRRRDGARGLQGQGAHRLSGGRSSPPPTPAARAAWSATPPPP